MAKYSRKASKEVPDTLKCLTFHGLELEDAGPDQAKAECPFCGNGKFYWGKSEEKGDCKNCKEVWNPVLFIRKVWKESEHEATTAEYEQLALDRGLTSPETLTEWGVRKSKLDGSWIIPGYNFNSDIVQLYRYVKLDGKMRLLATPGLDHGLHMPVPLPGGKKRKVGNAYVLEGPWDGMALYEMLRGVRKTDDGRAVLSSNPERSLYADAEVYAAPGSNVWKPQWNTHVGGKSIHLMYDSDKPNPQGVRAGYDGMKATASKVVWADDRPKGVWYLAWGEDGFDPNKPTGYDVRDHLKASGERVRDRIEAFADLLLKLTPVPDEWVPATKPKGEGGGAHINALPCKDWKTMINQWRKSTRWPNTGEGLDHALACMLACVTSTMIVGDQLWLKVIGPAACGKTMLCDAIGVATDYVKSVSIMRGFHSGYKGDGGGEDNSLIVQVNGKTMVTKDGDTLMTQGNVDQILAEARDVYDRNATAIYRNKINRSYEKLSMTWILCGTAALKALDKSELGERFLDCVVMNGIDRDTEQDIQKRVVSRVFRNLGMTMDDASGLSDDAEKVKALQLTGGYVNYLRQNAAALLSKVGQNVPQESEQKISDLATFVACCRARPSSRQGELAEREMSSRLTSQLAKMAGCLAVVLNRPTIDEQVMRRIERVAIDTARGITLDIVRELGGRSRKGVSTASLATFTHHTPAEVGNMMKFLRRIKVVEWFRKTMTAGIQGKASWRLTPWFLELHDTILGVIPEIKEAEVGDVD